MAGVVLFGAVQVAAADADSTGVPACDAFLKEYHHCAATRVPEPNRAEMLSQVALWRTQYRRMTTLPYKPDVAGACREARAQITIFLSKTYGCTFD
jgi:hypothetical protein